MNKIYIFLILFLTFRICDAQIDFQCTGPDLQSIYLYSLNPQGFYKIDSVDTNPTNPILITLNSPTGNISGGISINDNLDSITGLPTMYFVSSNEYFFWNGTSWTATGHSGGTFAAVNSGGTSNYIFNLDGGGNSVYRYDGTSNGTLLISNLITQGGIIYDIATDNQGNFYLFFTGNQKIIKYNPIGMPIDTFTTSGFVTGIHPGFAIIGNRLYAIANSTSGVDLYEGIKNGNNFNFMLIKNIALEVQDIATCPAAAIPLSVSDDNLLPHILIYPIPFFDKLNVLINDNKVYDIALYDLLSKKILQQKFTNSVSLSTEKLTKGIYFYQIKNKIGVIKTGRVMKN